MTVVSAPDRAANGGLHRDVEAYLLLEAIRWPDGPSSCPQCGAIGRCRLLAAPDGVSRPTRTGRPSVRRVWRCGGCRRQFSVLTGTVFERTRVPLSVWLDALSILSESGDRTSAAELAGAVGVSVDTARAMVALVRTGLSAAADETTRELQLQG